MMDGRTAEKFEMNQEGVTKGKNSLSTLAALFLTAEKIDSIEIRRADMMHNQQGDSLV